MRLHLPFRKDYNITVRASDKGQEYWDILRRRWLLLTPEEWVRQLLIHYFIEDLKYPKGRISIEKEIIYGSLAKRYDIVVYDESLNPWLLVECKSHEVPINEKVLHQLLIYHQQLQAPFWLLSNGNDTYCVQLDAGKMTALHQLPTYPFL